MVKALFAFFSLASLCAAARYGAEPYAIDGYTYLGCYYEPNPYRMLNDTFDLSYGMSGCQDYCRRINKRYAGMEVGDQCFCGNEVKPKDGVQRDESKCNYTCRLNTDEICGGYGWMSLYGRGGAGPPTTQSKSSATPSPSPSSSTLQQLQTSSTVKQQPQFQPSSSSNVDQPSASSSKTQQLGVSSALSEDGLLASSFIGSSSSSDGLIIFSFTSTSSKSEPTSAAAQSSDPTSSGAKDTGKSTLASVVPLLPQTTSLGGTPGSIPHFKDRKQIPLSGINITSGAFTSMNRVSGAVMGIMAILCSVAI